MVAASWEEWARRSALAAQTFPSVSILVGAAPPSGVGGKGRRDRPSVWVLSSSGLCPTGDRAARRKGPPLDLAQRSGR